MPHRRGVPWLLLLAALSCKSDDVLAPTDLNVSGGWLFVESVTSAEDRTCFRLVDLTIAQNGPRFSAAGTQQGTCTGSGGPDTAFTLPVALLDGTIDGTSIRFVVDQCPYEGTAYGAAPDSMAGTSTCLFRSGETGFDWQGRWKLSREDIQPPTVTGNTFGGAQGAVADLETGDDTLYVRIRAEDNRALSTMGYELRDSTRGQVVRRDSVLISGKVAEDTLSFALPLNLLLPAPDGTSFQARLFARDSAGHFTTEPLAPVLVRPATPPQATGTLTGATRDSAGALRDTLRIAVTASSLRPLTWFGYRITSFVSQGDSVATTDTAGTAEFTIPVPFAWKGLLLTFEVFTRDRLGLEDRRALGQVRVVIFPSRPTMTFRVGQGVSDVVYDAGRDRVYFTTAVDSGPMTGAPEVRIVQRSPAGFLPGILLPAFSDGLDLSPGGDSLLVTQYNTRLTVIDLTTGSLDSTAPISFTPSNGRYPFRVRAMANAKAMVSIASASWGDGSPGQLVEYDLPTDAQTLRTDVGTAGAIGLTPLLGRSADRQRLLVYSAHPTTSAGQLYRAGTNQFDPAVALAAFPSGGAGVSGDRTGSRWLVGNQLLSGDLTSLGLLGSTDPLPVASALADDGAFAYVAVPEGVAKFRTADRVEVERILLPDPPYRLVVTPDGTTLIAIGSPGLQMVDLR